MRNSFLWDNKCWRQNNSQNIIFDRQGKVQDHYERSSLISDKLISFESRRGNGLIVTRKILKSPELLFKSYDLIHLEQK